MAAPASRSYHARVPQFLYGTAWKKDRTRDLVRSAILEGFRGIDTAAQPKHYQEDLVGAGIRAALNDGHITRDALYIQTKFTSLHGQDPNRLPYDPKQSVRDQVNASIASSLRNLRHSESSNDSPYIDCLVLHSPYPSFSQTREAWQAMEAHVPHEVRTLGISNCYHLPVLRELFESAKVKPSVVQNRFYQDSGYDRALRAFCEERGVVYQSFWTLSANPHLLRSDPVDLLSRQVRITRPVALYGLVLGLGNVSVLNGTTNVERMAEDLAGLEALQKWSNSNASSWTQLLTAFDALLA